MSQFRLLVNLRRPHFTTSITAAKRAGQLGSWAMLQKNSFFEMEAAFLYFTANWSLFTFASHLAAGEGKFREVTQEGRGRHEFGSHCNQQSPQAHSKNRSKCSWGLGAGSYCPLPGALQSLASPLLPILVSMTVRIWCRGSSKHVFVHLLITALTELLLVGAGLRKPGAELCQGRYVDSSNELSEDRNRGRDLDVIRR